MGRVLICLAAFVACHSPAGSLRQDAVRSLEPAQLSQALADPSLGVILGAGRGAAVVLPLRRQGKVELWLPGPGKGARLTLEVEAKAAVGMGPPSEPPLALALASRAAARALGTDPTRFVWRAQLGDGAAAPPLWASAQMAAGLVAALAGWSIVQPRALVLGAIGPDGSLVAVPALEEVASRATAGTLVGLPPALMSGGEVAARVRAAGATPRALVDLAEAVALLTDRELPSSFGAALSDGLNDALVDPAGERAAWSEPFARARAALAARWDQVLVLDGAPHVPAAVRELAERAGFAAGLAERLFSQGELEAALVAQVAATAHAAAVLDARALVDGVQLGHTDEALEAAGLLAGAEGEAAALAVELAGRGQASAVASSDELALALEAWALAPALRAAERAWIAEVGELRGRALSDLGTAATAARLAASAVPLALHAAQVRATLELARLLAGRSRNDAPGDLERLAGLAGLAGGGPAGQWLVELERGAGRARERDEAILASAAEGLPRENSAFAALAAAQWRWADGVLRGIGEAAAWRVLAARVRVAGAEGTSDLSQAAGAAAASARAAQLATGEVPRVTRFWYAAGRALAAAGAAPEAARAYARALVAAELALAVQRAKVSAPADGPAAPRR